MDTANTRSRRRWPLLFAGLLAVGLAGGAWLAGSESGLGVVCAIAGKLSGDRLAIDRPGGRLIGPLTIGDITWSDGGDRIRAAAVSLDWQPGALFDGRLHLLQLAAARVQVELAPSATAPTLPASLRLPVALLIDKIEIGGLEKSGVPLASQLVASLDSSDGRHRFTLLAGESGGVALTGQAEMAAAAPFALQAKGVLQGRLADHPFRLDVDATGSLAAIDLQAVSRAGPLQGQAAATVTPLAPQPFSRLHLRLAGLDPAAWSAGAPTAQLDLSADVEPTTGSSLAIAGTFALANRSVGSLDRQRLPLASLAGRLLWREGGAEFSALTADLAGGGSLRGQGRWAGGTLTLALRGDRVDAAALDGRLRPTRLAGPITATVAAARQELAVDLADPRFALKARLRREGDEVLAETLQLRAGDASLQAAGRLDLGGTGTFAVTGDLQRFDPARFAKVPAASINARFEASGKLQPSPAGQLTFALHDSHLAGQPLAGRGDIDVRWPVVRKADITLVVGPNRLVASGAFGRPGDAMLVELAAPRLDPYGLTGGLNGTLRLAGTPAAPALSARLQAERFGVPGMGMVSGLVFAAEAGAQPADKLNVLLQLAAAEAPDRTTLLKGLLLRVEGSRRQHTVTASGEWSGRGMISLAASGGVSGAGVAAQWDGRLDAASLTPVAPRQAVRLVKPAPLRLGLAQWHLGPAEAGGEGWQGRFEAQGADGRLRVAGEAGGATFGHVSGELEAALNGAWSLDRTAPWRGKIQADIADVAWLGPLIADGVRSGGRLRGDLVIAGSPGRPLTSGQLRGDALLLHLVDQGLRLEHGELAADLDNNRLRVSRLTFASPLQAPPRALLVEAGKELADLAGRPGRLEVSGEMRIDGGADSAYLDLRLDRLGAFQNPGQWLLVSGSGRIDWRAGSLGVVAKLAVDAGYWQLAPLGTPQLSDDVVVKTAGGSPPATRRPPLAVDIETSLGQRFYFRGAGLESRLAGSVRLKAEGRDLPRASGSIRTVDGRFDAYGQKLEIERGILNFSGLLENPGLDVRAIRKGLAVEPGVAVTGTARRPVVRLISDPELADAEKLSWLVLGHGSDLTGSGDASVLLSAAGAILGGEAGGVVQQLKRTFGVDEFGIRSGQLGDSGARQATSRVVGGSGGVAASPAGEQILSVGKRLSTNAVLSYEQALGTTASIVKLTVSLNRQLSVVGRAGSDNALDLFYTLTFGGPARVPRKSPVQPSEPAP